MELMSFFIAWGVFTTLICTRLSKYKIRGIGFLGFVLGFCATFITFRTIAIMWQDDLDATAYDILFWIVCAGGLIFWQTYKRHYIQLSNQEKNLGNWLANGSNNQSYSDTSQQQTQTNNNDYFEELAVYTASSHIVYELSSDYGWNLSLLTFRQQEVLRNLQIIRESINISAKTKKQDIAESRLSLAHQLYKEVCNNYSDVFKNDLLARIKGIIDADLLNVHTEAYLNVANAHLDKALNAKRANTKAKYLGLAKEVLETGLSDPYSDKERIREQLAFNSRIEENI